MKVLSEKSIVMSQVEKYISMYPRTYEYVRSSDITLKYIDLYMKMSERYKDLHHIYKFSCKLLKVRYGNVAKCYTICIHVKPNQRTINNILGSFYSHNIEGINTDIFDKHLSYMNDYINRCMSSLADLLFSDDFLYRQFRGSSKILFEMMLDYIPDEDGVECFLNGVSGRGKINADVKSDVNTDKCWIALYNAIVNNCDETFDMSVGCLVSDLFMGTCDILDSTTRNKFIGRRFSYEMHSIIVISNSIDKTGRLRYVSGVKDGKIQTTLNILRALIVNDDTLQVVKNIINNSIDSVAIRPIRVYRKDLVNYG